MRDQGLNAPSTSNTPSAKVFTFLDDDIANIDFEELIKTVNNISQPSSDIINPTLDTGVNTAKFLQYLDLLDTASSELVRSSIKNTLKCMNELSKLTTVCNTAHLQATTNNCEHEITATNLHAIAHLKQHQRKKLQLWSRYSKMVRDIRGKIDTMKKVSRSLLTLQQTSGNRVRTDMTALAKLTISIKLLDGQWSSMKKGYVEMAAVLEEIGGLGRMRGMVNLQVVDDETGMMEVLVADLANLSLEFLRGQTSGTKEDAGDGEDETEEGRIVEVDEEENGEEVDAGAFQEKERENEAEKAGEE